MCGMFCDTMGATFGVGIPTYHPMCVCVYQYTVYVTLAAISTQTLCTVYACICSLLSEMFSGRFMRDSPTHNASLNSIG